MTTYRTKLGSDIVEISANFAEASCPVEGTNGRQVADFQHRPATAMRYALEQFAIDCGESLEDEGTIKAINDAVATMTSDEN